MCLAPAMDAYASHLEQLLWPAGSIFFSFSSIAGLFLYIARHGKRSQLMVAYPYAFGSTLYTWGAFCSVVASWQFLRSLGSSPADSAAAKDRKAEQQSLRMARQPGVPGSPMSQQSASINKMQILPIRIGWRNMVPVRLRAWKDTMDPDMAWALVDVIGRLSLTRLLNGLCMAFALMCMWMRFTPKGWRRPTKGQRYENALLLCSQYRRVAWHAAVQQLLHHAGRPVLAAGPAAA